MLIRVYTDGSCFGNPGSGGWGVIFVSDKGIEKMSGSDEYTTNNKMELLAVIKAIRKIKRDSAHKNNTYEIYSDSAYVINAITKGWLDKWKLNGWKTSDGKDIKKIDSYPNWDIESKINQNCIYFSKENPYK